LLPKNLISVIKSLEGKKLIKIKNNIDIDEISKNQGINNLKLKMKDL